MSSLVIIEVPLSTRYILENSDRLSVSTSDSSQTCSVENLDPHDNHQVVRDDLEEQRAALAMMGSRVQGVAEATLDHAEHRLDLSALAVAAALRRTAEVGAHLAAIPR